MDKKKARKQEMKIKSFEKATDSSLKSASSAVSLMDSIKEMFSSLANPEKSVEKEYNTNSTLKNAYFFITISLIAFALIALLPTFGINIGAAIFGIIVLSVLFVIYSFILLIAFVFISSFIWFTIKLFSSFSKNASVDFEKQTNAIVSVLTPLAVIWLIVMLILDFTAPNGIAAFAIGLILFLYAIYSLAAIVKGLTQLSWIRSLCIVAWPLLLIIVIYLIIIVFLATLPAPMPLY